MSISQRKYEYKLKINPVLIKVQLLREYEQLGMKMQRTFQLYWLSYFGLIWIIIVNSMVYVEFEYLYRKRQIFIQGQLDQNTFHYVTLLQKISQRFYLDRLTDFFAGIFNYQHEELGSVLIVFLTILSTEVVSHFQFNTLEQGGFAHLTLIDTLLVHILFTQNYRLILMSIIEIFLVIAIFVLKYYNFEDYDLTLQFLILNSGCVVVGLIRKVLQQQFEKKIFSIFGFESNLLIGIYLIEKMLHVYCPYLMGKQINALNLIPTIVCVCIINTLKIWNLFEFNPVYLIGLLTTVHNQQMQQMEKKSLFEQILRLGDSIHKKKQQRIAENDQINQNQTQGVPQYLDPNLIKSIKTSLPTNILAENDSAVHSLQNSQNESIKEFKIDTQSFQQSYTPQIWVAFLANFLFTGTLITLILLKTYSDPQLYLMSLGMFKATIIMLYCEHQSVIMAHNQKHGYFYFIHLLSDIFMSIHLIAIYLLYQYFDYTTNYGNFSLAVHSFVPFMTTTMYRSLSSYMNKTHSNKSMHHLFYCWILLLSLRQTLVIFVQKIEGEIYLMVDIFLFAYFCIIFLIVSKTEFYKWIREEVKKSRKMRKFKLYVMESLKTWKYDITELSQSFFLINSIILFLGYNYFKKQSLYNSCKYETEYFIVCGSALVIHLLQSYNNYYSQLQIDQASKPPYAPYYSYIGLILGSGIYVAASFLGDQENRQLQQNDRSHKRWSMLCMGLTGFLIFTNVLGHYTYETIQQFRHASKPINLVISYFIFYYPFITIFTVFFFTSNLQKDYIFQYAIAGFVYLTITSVTMGILVHAILNLMQKSKRTLFLIKVISEEMKNINMKQDSQFISMIENMHDLMDGNTEKLLQELKSQKISKILIHDDIDTEFDYSIVEPERKQKENQYVKFFADSIEKSHKKHQSRNSLKFHSIKRISNRKSQTKSNFYNKKLQEQQSPIMKFMGLNFLRTLPQNKNQLEVKRLIEAISVLWGSSAQLARVKKIVENSPQFREILKNQSKLRQMMHRFFHFLSHPADSFNFDTFTLLNNLLMTPPQINLKDAFSKFSQNGQSINEQGFRDFLVDRLKMQHNKSSQFQLSHQMWECFMKEYLFQFMVKGNDIFRYYMRRKNIELSKQSTRIWESLYNLEQEKQMLYFRHKYEIRKHKVLGKKERQSNMSKVPLKSPSNFDSNNQKSLQRDQNQQIQQKGQSKQQKNIKKQTLFMSTDAIYSLILGKLVDAIKQYEKIEHQHFRLQSIKCGLSNTISILTKLFDFTYLYMYGSIYAMYAYAEEQFSNNKHFLSFINYNIFFGVAFLGVIAYVGLIIFHKKQFANGSLGVDQNQRALSFTNPKFYTTFLLFLMGSSLSNLFIMTSLNSYMCEEATSTLWNFPENNCYTTWHLAEMFGSLLMLLTYYPLASLIFPFSSAIDTTLEIKYKAEYEIVYLQCKFLLNGIDVIFNQITFQTEELIKSVAKTVVCMILAFLFYKLRPCSVQFINQIQLKIYIGLIIINATGILCYFLSFTSAIISGITILFLYILYSLFSSIRISSWETPEQKYDQNPLVKEKFRKQQIFKIRIQQGSLHDPNLETDSNLYRNKSDLVEQDISLNDLIQNNNTKFLNVANIFQQDSLYPKTSKLKQKQKSKQPIKITSFKVQDKLEFNPDKQKTFVQKEQFQMIPATKRKSELPDENPSHNKMVKN